MGNPDGRRTDRRRWPRDGSGRCGSVGIPRWSERREDPEWVRKALTDPGARILPLGPDLEVPIHDDALGWIPVPSDLDPSAAIFLGEIDATPRFALDTVGSSGEPLDLAQFGLPTPPRAAVADLDPPEASALLQAIGVAGWHRRHRFCARCGAASVPESAGHLRRCVSCGTGHFPRTDPAVIMLVVSGEECVLGQRRGAPGGRWSTLAGYVEPGESLEAAVAREVYEEVGLVVDTVEYVGSQPWPFPASLMVAFEATAPRGALAINEEHSAVRWFSRDDLRRDLASGAIDVPGVISAGGYLIRRWIG
jgi:NAD+ diphosphatase